MSPQVLQLGVWGQDRGPGPCAVLFGTAEGAPAALPPLKAPSKGLVQMFGRGGLAAPDSGTLKILGVYSWIPAGELHILSDGFSFTKCFSLSSSHPVSCS